MMVKDIKIQKVKLPVEKSKSSESRKEVDSILSECSCPECDSLKCFILRRTPDNNSCNCPKKPNTCSNHCVITMSETKPKLDINRVITTHSVNKTVDISAKVSFNKILNTENGTVDTTLQSNISCKSIAQDSFKSQESFSEVKSTIQNFRENTAHLSAQIMKAGCIHGFNDCISLDEPNQESAAEIKNVKEYVYRKLKEIYNACSCKVCECIPTFPFSERKSICSCKPCQCDDCKELYNYVGCNLTEKSHFGCPCIRCDRKDCQGVVKKQTCSCKPCDCLMCTEFLSRDCTCAPCACFDCKYNPSYLRRSFVVAAVGQNNQITTCNCGSPCECSNCIPTYGAAGISQERSTGTVARAICPCNSCANRSCQSDGENCRCEIQKRVMTKPILKIRHDYDIRNVLLEDTDILTRNYNRDSMSGDFQQKLRMDDDPSQCIQKENRFATEYIQISLPNKNFQYALQCESKSRETNNTGNCLDCKELKSFSEEKDIPQLQNEIASYCNCEFCERQQFDYIRIGNVIRNHSLRNNTSSCNGMSFKNQPELLVFESITHTAGQSSQNVRACRVESSKQAINNTILEVNRFSTGQNSKISININNELKRNSELLISQRKKSYCVASIIKNFSLFSETSNSLCNKDKTEHSSSLNTLLPVTLDPATSTLNDVPENLNSLDNEERSINNNYFIKSSTLPFFNIIYDENQRTIKTFNYAHIKKTLVQAQEFSAKLKGILERYEAANNNFKSASNRLRNLYDEVLKTRTSDNKTYKVHFKHNEDTNKLYYVGDRISLTNETDLLGNNFNASIITSISSNSNKTILKPILGNHNLLDNAEYVKSFCVIRDEDIFGDTISNCCTRMEVNSCSTVNDTFNIYKRQRSPSDICKEITSFTPTKSNKFAETDFLYFRQTIMFSKSTYTQIDRRQQDEKLNTEITFRDADFYKDAITETSTIESLHANFENIVLPSPDEVKNHANNLHWNVLRKNIFLESDRKQNHNSDASRLELNIKEIIRIISQEIRMEFAQQDNMSFQRLHKVASKCYKQENKKASFSEITRISDHTVLVKWNIPNNISNIRGYEIDGRAVKNIFSPHCAMATITSLPESERVLLTILTITDSEGPYSSNTVVYNPRNINR